MQALWKDLPSCLKLHRSMNWPLSGAALTSFYSKEIWELCYFSSLEIFTKIQNNFRQVVLFSFLLREERPCLHLCAIYKLPQNVTWKQEKQICMVLTNRVCVWIIYIIALFVVNCMCLMFRKTSTLFPANGLSQENKFLFWLDQTRMWILKLRSLL